MKFKFASFCAAIIAVFAFSAVGFAQETKTTQDNTNTQPPMERGMKTGRFGGGDRMHGRHDEGRGGKMLAMLSELNLTDSQKQQVNTITETNRTNTQAQRDELKQLMMSRRNGTVLTPEQDTRAQELGSELRQSSKKMNDDLMVVLTPEQQQQFKQKRDEMRQQKQERRQMKQQNGETTQTPQQNQ